MTYRITPVQLAVHPEGTFCCDPDAATVVTLQGEEDLFSIRQGDHVIYVSTEELEPLFEACKQLMEQQPDRPVQEAPVDPSTAEQEPSETSIPEPAPAVVVRGVDGTLIDAATGEPVVAWMP